MKERKRHIVFGNSPFERQVLAFHYRHCEEQKETAFPPDLIHKVSFLDDAGVVYLASSGARLTALYFFERQDIGYAFRRLSTELEGPAVCRTLLATLRSDLEALAELGLSYREISKISRVELAFVRRLLGGG